MWRRAILDGQVVTALVMLAIFVSMSVMALGFPEKARLMPLMIGLPGSLLALIQVILELRTATAKAGDDTNPPEQQKAELHMFAWMFAFFSGILALGFVYAAPVLVFAFLYFGKSESVKVALVAALGTWVVLYGFFEKWFQIQLFTGLVVEWLSG